MVQRKRRKIDQKINTVLTEKVWNNLNKLTHYNQKMNQLFTAILRSSKAAIAAKKENIKTILVKDCFFNY